MSGPLDDTESWEHLRREPWRIVVLLIVALLIMAAVIVKILT